MQVSLVPCLPAPSISTFPTVALSLYSCSPRQAAPLPEFQPSMDSGLLLLSLRV